MIEGVVGIVKWSYYHAAAVNGYRVRAPERVRFRAAPTFTLRAVVVMVDRFKLSQRPLVFEAPFTGGLWRWPIEKFELADGVLTARLGPLEEVYTPCRPGSSRRN